MPLALIILAAFLVMTGITGNYSKVGAQFSQDVTGQGGFISFLEGIIGIAVFFRVIGMPNAGRIFLFLVIIVYLISNPGVLSALQSAISSGSGAGTAASASAPTPASGSGTAATPGSGS